MINKIFLRNTYLNTTNISRKIDRKTKPGFVSNEIIIAEKSY